MKVISNLSLSSDDFCSKIMKKRGSLNAVNLKTISLYKFGIVHLHRIRRTSLQMLLIDKRGNEEMSERRKIIFKY